MSCRKRTRLAVLLGCVLLVAGCANVPQESQPQVVPGDRLAPSADIPEPQKGLDALDVVRNFVHASALPVTDNARVYLNEAARKSWSPTKSMTVIEDRFDTVYGASNQLPPDPDEQVVLLRGFTIGNVAPDSAFIPTKGDYRLPVTLRKQAGGEWRIVDPPGGLVITENDFTQNYFRVPLYFFAQDSNALVLDLRYVPSKPQAGLAGRVVDLLIRGPSSGLAGAVRSPLGDQAATESNVKGEADGALVVPLTGVDGYSVEQKKLIAAQLVLSLQSVTTSRVRLLSDGKPLIDGEDADWLPSDLPSYGTQASPSFDLPGLMVVNGRIRSLEDNAPIPGPVGSGAYQVLKAAQSLDGKQLAIVESVDGQQRLRIGEFGRDAQSAELQNGTLTRPTWRPTSGSSGEVWSVVDGVQVVRVQRNPDNKWVPQAVIADEITSLGTITALRLSRDGSRAAVVVGGQLVIAAVVRTQDSVMLREPRVLKGGDLAGVEDVDWLSQDTVVVATSSASLPVAKLPIDGLRMDPFNSSNLTQPVRAIAAAPGSRIVVADSSGLWTASSDVGEVWRPHPHSPSSNAYPFYPG
ncbi:LpqB family beta-propeller domain-containing protein [Amycolatopsis nigrescens]|uniref:LpqB family beta-propeller domain-containing protein n=1 Tax=Amycolatopsis nigrescens TaxID=381445 RepID=UPI00058FED09|nr:LpqB family beta-propeller domain-containing protein [Amycolatopsis nigrescens]